jgi:membrane dipeptidase
MARVLPLFPMMICAVAAVAAGSAQKRDDDRLLERARALLRQSPLIDGHNDYPWALRENAGRDLDKLDIAQPQPSIMTDIARLRAGGVGGQFWSAYVPVELAGQSAVTATLEQIDIVHRMMRRYPRDFALALTADDVERAFSKGRIASLIGMEGGHAIEDSLGALRAYYDLGVRYMTLTHNVTTSWADSQAVPPEHGGLTPFGEQVVLEMNKLGMLVDLSHVSPATMDDAIRVSRAPVIFSHSSARAVNDVPRNVPDDILKRLKTNGGVVMVTFVAGFIDPAVAAIQLPAMAEITKRAAGKTPEERDKIEDEVLGKIKMPPTSIAKVADHIEHIRDVAGVEHIGLGGDFDGNTQWPVGLSDVSMYPNLFAELIRRGWSDNDLKLLAGENVLRAMEQAEAVSRRHSR